MQTRIDCACFNDCCDPLYDAFICADNTYTIHNLCLLLTYGITRKNKNKNKL